MTRLELLNCLCRRRSVEAIGRVIRVFRGGWEGRDGRDGPRCVTIGIEEVGGR